MSRKEVRSPHSPMMATAVPKPRPIRSRRPAPKFWATKALTAVEKPPAVIQEMDSIWLPTF